MRAFLLTLALTACNAGGAVPDSGVPSGHTCARHQVTPSETDASASFVAAMQAASADAVREVETDAGGQTVVYLPAGVYTLGTITVASNVRFEIEPGAVIRPAPSTNQGGSSDVGLFVLGTRETPARNVTFTAGDGCGGPGTPVPVGASPWKPTDSSFRGNDENMTPYGTRGLHNAAIPFSEYWREPLAAMWVLDLDPRATKADWQITGFLIAHAFDVSIEHVFSIQNAEQEQSAGQVSDVTSRTTVLMFDPPKDTPYDPSRTRDTWIMPHRVRVDWHYNVLSPSGQGPNQVRGCIDCSFHHVFSHGGSVLRVETDGLGTTCGNNACGCTGPNGVGFSTFSMVDGLVADHIEGAFGNRAVQLTPHCLPNGSVAVHEVRGTSMDQVVVLAGAEAPGNSGLFTSVHIADVAGCGGAYAQYAMPKVNAYTLGPSESLIGISPDVSWATFEGTWAWPLPPADGGMPRGNLPSGVAVENPSVCPAPWPPGT
jgi:hypothetical protein